jgi:hypothetical protein
MEFPSPSFFPIQRNTGLDKLPPIYRQRNVQRRGARHVGKIEPLSGLRAIDAYVLLGEQGAGKSSAFQYEARETPGGLFVTARNLSHLEASAAVGKTLFIDGLDERRAGTGELHTPLENIRHHLQILGRPRFRISCREADWLGESDSDALNFIAPGGEVAVFHLAPLSDEDILAILTNERVADPEAFVRRAKDYQLAGMLSNPQTLKMVVRAVETAWPSSRSEIYELACRVEAVDSNKEHQTATECAAPAIDSLLDAAGFLCATILLSGQEGVTRFTESQSRDVTPISELGDSGLPLLAATKTRLFQDLSEGSRTYSHRTVAEFLAARYLAARIESRGLPFERVLSVCTGQDGGVSPDLRGFCAWLSVYSSVARLALIERDPLGLILYGDVARFTPEDKRRLLDALRHAAIQYPGLRSDDWTSKPFGGLSTADTTNAIKAYLAAPPGSDGEQVFQDCVLDAVANGEKVPHLEPLLQAIARNDRYWPRVRRTAIEAIARVSGAPDEALRELLDDIHAGKVEDRDDELMGYLLEVLYGRGAIQAQELFDYLRAPKQSNLIGSYHMFWTYHLARIARASDLPMLMAEMEKRRAALDNMLESHVVDSLAGELIVRTLEALGDAATDEEIYGWLGVGLGEWGRSRLDATDAKRVSAWIEQRPDRYRMLAERPAQECRTATDVVRCLVETTPRLFGAAPPSDIVEWYLTKAAEETHPELAEYFFRQAVIKLHQRDQSGFLSDASLDLLEQWVVRFPKFSPWREDATTMRLDHWQREESSRLKKYRAEQSARKAPFVSDLKKHLSSIALGTAPPGLMFELALVADGRRVEGRGDTPEERLKDFFDGDSALINAALSGLPKVPERSDLPSLDEIVSVAFAGNYHYIREPALLGMEMRYQADPIGTFATLDDSSLERLCAFGLTKSSNDDADWYVGLAQVKPAIVARVLVVYAERAIKAKRDYVTGLYQLANSSEFAKVATIAVPQLLESFPIRCQVKQLSACLDPLLKAALKHVERSTLLNLIDAKLSQASMDRPQRVYWLACGTLLAATRYLPSLLGLIRSSASRRGQLASFWNDDIAQKELLVGKLPDSELADLIEAFAPEASPDPFSSSWGHNGRRGRGEDLGGLVRFLMRNLEQRDSDVAIAALERMLKNSAIASWHNALRSVLNTVRVARRKKTLNRLTPRQVSQIIVNDKPANAGDLAAITVGHLRDIARKIRLGATNDYKQYWDFGSKPTPRAENVCRDALLSQLDERLRRYGVGIPAFKEGHVSGEKRVDIMVQFGGANGAAVPVEIKRDTYRKGAETIWTALRTQLIDRYAQFPTADGHGVYVVLWFGVKGVPTSPSGIRPKSASELEEQLRALLKPEESRIQIVVVDCALPSA